MWMTVGERRFAITLSDNAAARAFAGQLPLTLDMSELNGNEKHAELREALPADASRPGTIQNGDLMLYGTNTLVVFYARSIRRTRTPALAASTILPTCLRRLVGAAFGSCSPESEFMMTMKNHARYRYVIHTGAPQ